MFSKTVKMICLLACMGVMTLGFSGLAMADAPAPEAKKVAKRGINYPAYLYAKGARGEADYKKYVRPAKGYVFTEDTPLAAQNHVSEW